MKETDMDERANKHAYKRKTKTCVDCGKEFIAKAANTVRCEDCRAVYRKEYAREYGRERYWKERSAEITEREAMGLPAKLKTGPKPKPKPVKKKKHDPNICTKIKSCAYGGHLGSTPICDYLSKTGERRPCPAGECVMFKRKG